MRRRTFLTLAGGAATASGVYGEKRSMQSPSSSPIPIGFLGASHSHADAKLMVVRGSAEWRLVGVSDDDSKIQERLRGEGIAPLSREALLAHPEIRVIAVESAVADHARDGMAVLASKKHLHLEKAPADRLAPFQEIVTQARKNSLLLQIGYMWRYHPAIEKALAAAREGWLGAVYMVRAVIGNKLVANRRPEWAAFAGGVMFELGGHVIDPMVRLMGRPHKVTPFLHTHGRFTDNLKDNTAAVLEWNNAMGIVQSATLQPNSSRYRAFEIHGTNGSVIVNPIEPPSLTVDLEKPAGPYTAGPQKVDVPSYRRYVDDFVELAAAVRGRAKLRVSYEEDLLVHETLLRCSGMAR